jgi:catechol 2,3-dioxygenase-like lactoylglutathione lyase family enzyme
MTSSFHPAIPILRIFDLARAKDFYVDFLGFTVDWEHRFDPDAPVYMQVSRSDCRIHLSEHHGDGTPGTTIRVEVDELEAYHADLVAKRYKYYRPGLQDQEWGLREMSVKDPFGNQIIFNRPIERPA